MASLWLLSVCQYFYALPEPQLSRTKPLRVICLGLPRSGTDSLHNALRVLGFDGVTHGFDWWVNYPHNGRLYIELAILKYCNRLPSPESLRYEYFNRLLGDKEATTDVPTVWFAEELVKAYPEAKVVLSRRHKPHTWKQSFRDSILPFMQSWHYWCASWFDAELFWCLWLTNWGHGTLLFKGDFEANAEVAYTSHYEKLVALLEEDNREYLDWSVKDGWYV